MRRANRARKIGAWARPARLLAALAVVALLAAACGSSGNDSSGADTGGEGSNPAASPLKPGLVNVADAPPPPVAGGTLQFSEYTPTLTIDPAEIPASGATGNILGGAVFDVLMRYNPANDTYEPKLAKSLTANADNTVWTLKLRPEVHFTDGTVLDAEAVVFNLERYAAGKKAGFGDLAKLITKFETPDPLTVVMHLDAPWSGFPFLLADTGGMMVSPTAAKQAGDGIGKKPVGAGPFKVASFVPGERVELVRNNEYWDGQPYLDGITVTSVATASATLDRLQSGQVQMVFMLGTKEATEALQAGFPGYIGVANGQGMVLNIGNGPPDDPLRDVRVRQAIAASLNLEQIDQRASQGNGLFSTQLFGPWSPLEPGTPGPAYDPERAKRLLDEVKAETGWDGALRLVDSAQRDPAQRRTIQAQMNRVGFKVTVEEVPTINDLIRTVIVDQDFDMAIWGLTAWKAGPWATMGDNFTSTSSRNYGGYKNPEMDKLWGQLRAAPSPEARQQVLDQIQQLVTREVPFVVLQGRPYTVFWAKNVHGIVPTQQSSVLLDKAYISK